MVNSDRPPLPAELADYLPTNPAPERFRQLREGTKNELQKKIQQQKNNLLWLIWARRILLLILFVGFLCYWGFCYGQGAFNFAINGNANDSEVKPTALLFNIVPLAMVIAIITAPFIWGVRILGRAIDDCTILLEDLLGRINIEEHLIILAQFPSMRRQRENIDVQYLENWLRNSSADRLIQLRHKQGKKDESDIALDTLARRIEDLRQLILSQSPPKNS